MTDRGGKGEGRPSFEPVQADVVRLRGLLQGVISVETSGASINGQTFEFVTPLDKPVPSYQSETAAMAGGVPRHQALTRGARRKTALGRDRTPGSTAQADDE